MSLIEALLLGFIQGLTEFLPISSSGHIMLGERFFGITQPQLLFNVVTHVGTLVAVMLFYYRDVVRVTSGACKGALQSLKARSIKPFSDNDGAKLALLIVLATIPTGIIGVVLDRFLEPGDGAPPFIAPELLPTIICASLIINGFILMSITWFKRDNVPTRAGTWALWNITPALAIYIGIAQGFAVLPGFSRSGLTIVIAVLLGVWRIEAARFSFLLSIPAILGALVLKFDAELFAGLNSGTTIFTYLLAAIVAGVMGYISLVYLIKLLRKAELQHFAWYCWIVGILGLTYLTLF